VVPQPDGLGGGGGSSSGSSGAAGVASYSWRRRVLSWSVMNSRLPKQKLWDGWKSGGAHNPSRGIAGNTRVPKRIILPWLAAGAAVGGEGNYPIAEAMNARSAPNGRCQSVGSENGQQINYSIARFSRVGSEWSSTQ